MKDDLYIYKYYLLKILHSKHFHSQMGCIHGHVVSHFGFETMKANSEFLCWNRNSGHNLTLNLRVPLHSHLIDLYVNFFIYNKREFLPALKFYHHEVNHVRLSAFSATCLTFCFLFTGNSDVCCDEIEHLIQRCKI